MTTDITLRASTFTNGTGPTAATKPTGTTSGDVLVAFVAWGSGTLSPPTGWTTSLNDSSSQVGIFWKAATASEPSTYTFSAGAGVNTDLILECWEGVDTTAPIDQQGTAAPSTSGTTQAATAVTTAYFNAVVIAYYSTVNNETTFTPATGYTADGANSPSNGTAANYAVQRVPASSGTITATWNATDGGGVTVTISIKPAVAVRTGPQSASTTSSVTSLAVNKPSTMSDGDVVIIAASAHNNTDPVFSVSGGTGTWAQIGSYQQNTNAGVSLFAKTVVTAASEPATYTVSCTNANRLAIATCAVHCAAGSPTQDQSTGGNSAASPVTVSALTNTGTYDAQIVVWGEAVAAAIFSSAATGFAKVIDISNGGTSSTRDAVGIYVGQNGASGSTGTSSWTPATTAGIGWNEVSYQIPAAPSNNPVTKGITVLQAVMRAVSY